MLFSRAGLIGLVLLGCLIGCSSSGPANSLTPTLTPTVDLLPMRSIVPTPVPASLNVITLDNAVQLTEVARLGRGGIANMSISPNGQAVALISRGDYYGLGAWLYDAATLQPLHLFEHLQDISWSPDGTRLALQEMTLSPNGYEYTADTRHIQVWSVNPLQQLFVVDGYGVTWSPDGQRFATRDRNHQLSIWNAKDGQRLDQIPFDVRDISKFVWSPNGQQIAIIGHDIEILDVTHTQPGRMLAPAGNLQLIGWSPDGSLIAGSFVSMQGTPAIRLYAVDDVQAFQDFVSSTKSAAPAVAWSPDGKRLALSRTDGADGIYRRGADGQITRQLDISLNAAAWSPDGRHVALVDQNSLEIRDGSNQQSAHVLTSAGNVEHIGWLTNDQLMSFGGNPRQIRTWNARTGEILKSSDDLSGYCNRLRWSPDGTRLAFVSNSSTAVIWEAATGHWLQTIPSHGKCTEQKVVDWSADGQRLLTGDIDQRLRVWDAASGQLLQTLEGSWGEVESVAWSAAGHPLVSARSQGLDQSYLIWDAATGKQIETTNPDPLDTRGWSPDEQQFANGAAIIDGKTKQSVYTFTGLGTGGYAAWSPDGRMLATLDGADWDRFKLWNTTTGQAVAEFKLAPPALAIDLAWSPDGTRLALGCVDGTIRIWGVPASPVK